MPNYQDLVLERLGSNFKHKTLRTIFDYRSQEWTETSLEEKLQILKSLLDHNGVTLETLIIGYKHYYSSELSNKSHVIKSLEKSLEILLENALE